ncbi:MAG: HAMP domain-containing histidine kinase [Gammaproteobacteria bacterium]|nr:HAMP domain-containing histidine kinase [Gammaproteobacteria bacterium]MDH5801502.1 HAMP domain-containing histidine kinase [Gammaproteobacteria bacterium]
MKTEFVKLSQLYLCFCIILLSVNAISISWEFYLEELITGEQEAFDTQMEFVSTVVVFSVLSLLYPFCRLRRWLIVQNQVQLELEEAKRIADQASSAKTLFVAQLSHELKTPMSAIKGYAEFLRTEPCDAKLQSDLLARIESACEYTLSIVHDSLDLAAVESGHVVVRDSDFDLNQVLDECRDLIMPQLQKKSLDLSVNYAEESHWVCADRTLVKQIVLNLLSNAVKYNSESGKIILTCDNDANGGVRLDVQDTGPGLSEQDQKKIFLPFVRLSSGEEGAGIGLSVTQKLAETQGIKLGVNSVQGQGATFWLKFAC